MKIKRQKKRNQKRSLLIVVNALVCTQPEILDALLLEQRDNIVFRLYPIRQKAT